MSARSLRARLAKLGTPPAKTGPVCRWHGTACGMGRTWPAPFVPAPDDELLEMLEDIHRRGGREPRPTRRDRWARDDHDLVPPEELAERDREAAEALARLQERNRQIEAELRASNDEPW